MKKLLLTSLFLLISLTFFAQASFTAMGIAVQGIARDNQNNKYNAKKITLVFQFFYYESGNATTRKNIGSSKFKEITTDDFGVFSTIIDDYDLNNSDFSNHKIWISIKVQGDANPLQETQLMHVPYAISANNGVPTGSIIPFIGTTAPKGWLMCDGETTIPSGALKTMLGTEKTPDLRSYFLKGAGDGELSYVDPITLKAKQNQQSALPEHSHGVYINTEYSKVIAGDDSRKVVSVMEMDAGPYKDQGIPTLIDLGWKFPKSHTFKFETTSHRHLIDGSTNNTIIQRETRPSSYGVNYIIKL